MTGTKTRKIVATLAATAALAVVPAAADAATHSTSTSGTASTYDSGSPRTSSPTTGYEPGSTSTASTESSTTSTQKPIRDAFAAHDGVTDDQCRKTLAAWEQAVQNQADLELAGKTAEADSWGSYALELRAALEKHCVLVY